MWPEGLRPLYGSTIVPPGPREKSVGPHHVKLKFSSLSWRGEGRRDGGGGGAVSGPEP